jgi:hypothetical protein
VRLRILNSVEQPTVYSGAYQPPSKLAVNFCVINRLPTPTWEITGIHVAPASRKPLRGNRQIDWSDNFLTSPLRNGEGVELTVDCTDAACFDIRIDIDTGNGITQYFHRSANFPEGGQILHTAIVSADDNSAKWKIQPQLDMSFGQ